MPGIFDPQNGGLLGGIFGALGASSPGGQEVQFRQKAYQEAQQNGDPYAALLMTNPQAYQEAWNRQIFQAQLQDYQRRDFQSWRESNPKSDPKQYPGVDLNKFLYQSSAGGQKERYGVTPVPGYETASGAKAPGAIINGQLVAPPGMGFPGNNPVAQTTAPPNSPVGSAQPQASPGIGGSPGPLSPMDRQGIEYKSQLAGAEEIARKQADANQQYPSALVTSQDAVNRLEAFKAKDLSPIIGGPLGLKGRTAAMGQTQADLVNEATELQGKIIANALDANRSVSGRAVPPGTLKELTVGWGDLIAGRKGTQERYKQLIDNSIDLIKNQTQAAWEATGKRGAAPTWGSPAPVAAPAKKYPEGTVAHNKQTNEIKVMRAGQWVNP